MYRAPVEVYAGGLIKEESIHHTAHAKAADIQIITNGINQEWNTDHRTKT